MTGSGPEDGQVRLRHEVHHGRVVPCHPERPANLDAMLASAAARAPDRIALVEDAMRLSYAELDRLVARCAGWMASLDVGAGDRVALLLDNRTDFLVAVFAAARIGAISVPMNIRQKRPETAHAVGDSGAVLLIHEASLADQIPGEAEVPALRHRVAIDDGQRLWDRVALSVSEIRTGGQVGEDEIACLLYTSGTTGRPKGAMLTHFGLVTSCIGTVDALGLGEGEVTILAVPASHVTGLMLELLLMVHLAGTTVLQRGFKARRFLELAAAERMTYTIIVPAMYVLCLMDEAFDSFDLSSWRVGCYGGAAMAETTIAELARKLPQLRLSNIYGSTETTSPSVVMPHGETAARLHQVGRALPYCHLIIMDEEGRELPPDTQGEIWIAGPHICPGYWRNAEATAAGFVNGYWRSGDLGALDADGYLRIFDRKKDMINRGGFKIYSLEVENVLMAHPAVVEAGVVGRPCPVLGERVEAFVVVEGGADADALRAWCAERLSDYKVPDHVTPVPGPLPRNANGKLLKTALREWVLARADQDAA